MDSGQSTWRFPSFSVPAGPPPPPPNDPRVSFSAQTEPTLSSLPDLALEPQLDTIVVPSKLQKPFLDNFKPTFSMVPRFADQLSIATPEETESSEVLSDHSSIGLFDQDLEDLESTHSEHVVETQFTRKRGIGKFIGNLDVDSFDNLYENDKYESILSGYCYPMLPNGNMWMVADTKHLNWGNSNWYMPFRTSKRNTQVKITTAKEQ